MYRHAAIAGQPTELQLIVREDGGSILPLMHLCLRPSCKAEDNHRLLHSYQQRSSKVWYDTEQDIFCLKCPASIRSIADELLGDLIARYADAELVAAEDEECVPHGTRFPKACLEIDDECNATSSWPSYG